MQQFTQFVIHHWELWLALVVLIALIIRLETSTNVKGIHLLSPQQVIFMMNQQQARLLDIRSDTAFKRGHIAGAVHVNANDSVQHIERLALEKSHPVIVQAEQDPQALQLALKLRDASYEYVAILKGGTHAWLAQNLPLIKG